MDRKIVLSASLVLLGSVAACGGSTSRRTAGAGTSPGSTTAPAATTTPTAPTAPTVPLPPVIAPATSATATPPRLSALSPTRGSVDGGTAVTLSGKGFQASGAGDTFVLFGTKTVRATPVSNTEVRVSAPAADAPGPVEVRLANGNGIALLASGFGYDARPATLAFEPRVGHDEVGLGGTKVTLTLHDFAPLTSNAVVRFGTVAATAVAFVGTTVVVAEVPAGVAAGLVDVTVEDAGARVVARDFRVQGALAYGDLIVNEFCPHPAGADTNRDGTKSSSGDEFVEVLNTTKDPIDLSFLTIRDSKNEKHRFPNPTSLPPGGAIVVFGAGTPMGFAAAHRSGQAQAATTDSFGLSSTGDSVELRTLPGANLSGVGATIFRVDYKTAPAGSSFVNANDGQKITANPATNADYLDHAKAPGAKGLFSPGVRSDGSGF